MSTPNQSIQSAAVTDNKACITAASLEGGQEFFYSRATCMPEWKWIAPPDCCSYWEIKAVIISVCTHRVITDHPGNTFRRLQEVIGFGLCDRRTIAKWFEVLVSKVAERAFYPLVLDS